MRERRTPLRRSAGPTGSTPLWGWLAYQLWRRQRLTYRQIQLHLSAEGWDVSIPRIAEHVGRGLEDELIRRQARREGGS